MNVLYMHMGSEADIPPIYRTVNQCVVEASVGTSARHCILYVCVCGFCACVACAKSHTKLSCLVSPIILIFTSHHHNTKKKTKIEINPNDCELALQTLIFGRQ